jgi:hypothetical protein
LRQSKIRRRPFRAATVAADLLDAASTQARRTVLAAAGDFTVSDYQANMRRYRPGSLSAHYFKVLMNCTVRREEAKSKRSAAIETLSCESLFAQHAAPSIGTARIGKPNRWGDGARAKTGRRAN